MSRVVCRRGVARGALSRSFSPDQLLDALRGDHAQHVYIEVDGSGWLTACGGGGAARVAVRARLAPHVHAAAALLTCAAPPASAAPAATPALRLRAALPLAPHAELLLWFAEDALAALAMPFLTPRNIGARHYACHACGAAFAEPNPLKLHLFLSCAPFEPRAFWHRAARRLAAAPPAPAPAAAPAPAPALSPGALEALATAWGRGRGGHACMFCGKLYSRRYGLKIHLRTHTGYRPLRCRYCLRAFGDPSNLNKHVRLHAAHAAHAPHVCRVCGRALARRRDLQRHERTHAPPAPPPPPAALPPPLPPVVLPPPPVVLFPPPAPHE